MALETAVFRYRYRTYGNWDKKNWYLVELIANLRGAAVTSKCGADENSDYVRVLRRQLLEVPPDYSIHSADLSSDLAGGKDYSQYRALLEAAARAGISLARATPFPWGGGRPGRGSKINIVDNNANMAEKPPPEIPVDDPEGQFPKDSPDPLSYPRGTVAIETVRV